MALVQADIWATRSEAAKRSEAGDIYELDPLLVEETTCTRTAFSTLVDELAHQGHLLVRHNKGLRCKVCNVYRADRQFRFWSRHPCLPRPSAAVCHLPVQKQEKTAHQHVSRKLVSRSRPIWRTQQNVQQTRRERTLSLHFFGLSGHPVHTQSPGASPSACFS